MSKGSNKPDSKEGSVGRGRHIHITYAQKSCLSPFPISWALLPASIRFPASQSEQAFCPLD